MRSRLGAELKTSPTGRPIFLKKNNIFFLSWQKEGTFSPLRRASLVEAEADACCGAASMSEAEPAAEAEPVAAPAPEASTETAEAAPVVEEPALEEAAATTTEAVTGEKRLRDDDPPPLPPGWIEAKDPRYNDTTYWYHADTKQTSWSRPTGPPDGAAPPLPAAAPPVDLPSTDELELILDDWVRAKRAKEFDTADRIRDGLRAQGIDPDIERPNNTHHQRLGGLQRSVQQPPAQHNPYAAAPLDAQADLERWAAYPSPCSNPNSNRSLSPLHTRHAPTLLHRASRIAHRSAPCRPQVGGRQAGQGLQHGRPDPGRLARARHRP